MATLAVTTVLQLVVVNYWPGFASPNERARAYQALALANQGTLAIDRELARFGSMEDVACHGGRCFPNKAPGLLPLVLPAAWLAQLGGGESVSALRWTLYGGRLLASSLPFVLTVVLLVHLVVPAFPRGGPFAVAAYALATPALPASLLLFSHAFTALCLLAAYWLLTAEREVGLPRAALAGFLLGWGVTAEYPVAVPALVLAGAALPRLRWRGAAAAIAGAFPPLALLGVYNAACFGAPFSVSSAHEANATFASLSSRGLFGISWPEPWSLVGLLLSPMRGVLVWAPVLAVALAVMLRGCPRPRVPGALGLASLALAVLLSGYPNWHGGWFPGPRYLLPALPLLSVATAAGSEWVLERRWGRALASAAAAWGCVAAFGSLATFPFPPDDFPVPWATFSFPLAAEGIHAPSWLPGGLVLPLFALLGLGGVLLVVLLASGRNRAAGALALASLAVAVSLTLRVAPPSMWRATLERAVVHDVYAGGRPGSLEALVATPGISARQGAEVEAWIARRRTLQLAAR